MRDKQLSLKVAILMRQGITLINIMGKIYSQKLLNRLNKWVETEEKLLYSQFGFQKGKSTVDCIFAFSSIIAKTLSLGENCIVSLFIMRKPLIKLTGAFYVKSF